MADYPPNWAPEPEEWGIEDPDGEVVGFDEEGQAIRITFVDDETYYKLWEKNLDSLSEKPALNTLVAHGCDRTELVALLVRLQGLNTPAFTAVSKADVRSAIREIRTAHNRLFNLQFSEISDLFPDDVDWFQVCRDLKRAVSKLEEYDPKFKKNSRPDLARQHATIVEYVRKHTGQPHDNELSILLGVALDKEYDLESLKMWRHRHKDQTG